MESVLLVSYPPVCRADLSFALDFGVMPAVLVALWLCAAGSIGAPQQAPPKGGVTLVTIEVTVVDRAGVPVRGLTAQDFDVRLNGASRPVRAVTYAPSATTAGAPMVGAVGPVFDASPAAPSAVYRLAVEVPSDATAGEDVAVAVTVRRPGLTAQTIGHAIVPSSGTTITTAAAPPLAMSVDDQLRAALTTGRTSAAVPIALARALRRGQDATRVDVGVRIEIPATVEGPLTAMFGLVDEAGAMRSGKQTIDAPPGDRYDLTFSVPVAPGRYRLRFAVADADGAIGSIESTVTAQLTTMGPLTASDLLLSTIDGKGGERPAPAMELLPSAAKTLNASLELYPAAGGAMPGDVLVKIALSGAGQTPPEIERVVTPETVGGVLRADAEFPVERLPRGVYSIRATVLIGATAVGTTSTTVRK